MSVSDIKLTKRLKRVFAYANEESEKNIYPIHLFLGVLRERTGILGELYLKLNYDIEELRKRIRNSRFDDENMIKSPFFKTMISESTARVINKGIEVMNRYGQIYLNEGHIIKALLNIDNPIVEEVLVDIDKQLVLETTTAARDMIVSLKNYERPVINNEYFVIRKAEVKDKIKLIEFVLKEFNQNWAKNVEKGLSYEDIPIYIALNEEEILGFAVFDVVRDKKGLFGPMGVSRKKRINGIGYSLLHHCLHDMKCIGYEYAVISEAGPLEFYENACNAVVIPQH